MRDVMCCRLRWRAMLFVCAALPAAGGCVEQAEIGEIPKAEPTDARLAAILDRIAADPLAFLKQSLAETRKLKTLRMRFQRQERLGLFKTLRPTENMIAEYRDAPFSVRFTWLDENSEYRQCVYVEGRNDNQVVLLPRHGFLGGPARVAQYPANFAVLFHKARNPITDFGPRRMMERTLDRIEKARPHGEVSIELAGLKKVGPDAAPCFHFQIVYPPGDAYPCKLHDLYISTRTHLPMGTYLWLSNTNVRTPQTLDAKYVYSRLEPNVPLGDEDFVIRTADAPVGATEARGGVPTGQAGREAAE